MYNTETSCNACQTGTVQYLGQLGLSIYGKCRHCGHEQLMNVDPDDDGIDAQEARQEFEYYRQFEQEREEDMRELAEQEHGNYYDNDQDFEIS